VGVGFDLSGVYRELSETGPNALIQLVNVYRDRSRSIAGMPFDLTVDLTVKKGHRAPGTNLPSGRFRVDGKFRARNPASMRISGRSAGSAALTVNCGAPRRYVAPGGRRFVIRCAGQWKGRGRDNLPLVDLWKYIINCGLSELRSTRGHRSVQTRTAPTATGD
jgi:hypothetical protein